jgi:2-polyprenyl-6-methoxyphenol hydroxylase-like FAD-dependent oxidoreductase
MRKIAIVGSGITGLVAAHGLLRAGFEVDLYSDRSAAQWLHESRPTGTAARFDLALSYERELGLNHWDEVAPRGEGVHLTFCPTLHNPLVRLIGRQERPFQAVDVRLQSYRWTNDFEAAGGHLILEQVTAERLDAIAADHDLTIVASGRSDLSALFARDEQRSLYTQPQRNLAMVVTTGAPLRIPGIPLLPVKFDFLGTDGEIFFVPYYHKDLGPSWNLLFEAKPGSRMDRFAAARSGVEALEIGKQVVRELFPWDEPFVRHMQLADANGWLVGKVTPAVRHPVARLASGRLVTALGDASISYDPIAAQGANSGVKQARHLVSSIIGRGDRPFDGDWMSSTFEAFYDQHARYAYTFSSLLLEAITAAGKELLIAQYGSDGRAANHSGAQQVANAFFENFSDPRLLTPAFTDMALAREVIARHTGGPWLWNGIRGRAAIARDQVKLKLGGQARLRAAGSSQPNGSVM